MNWRRGMILVLLNPLVSMLLKQNIVHIALVVKELRWEPRLLRKQTQVWAFIEDTCLEDQWTGVCSLFTRCELIIGEPLSPSNWILSAISWWPCVPLLKYRWARRDYQTHGVSGIKFVGDLKKAEGYGTVAGHLKSAAPAETYGIFCN